MINYRNGKERIKINEYGSLYIDRKKIEDGHRPLIYIGGQMEHRCHVLEQTGYTMDIGHNMFDGSWFYDYHILRQSKCDINSIELSYNLIKALNVAGIDAVDLITMSYGGMVAASATRSNVVKSVVAVHPPFLGTPLASLAYRKNHRNKLNSKQKFISKVVGLVIDEDYEFEEENFFGLNHPNFDGIVRKEKITVVGSNIDIEKEKNPMVKELYNLIYSLTNEKSDGVVIHDSKKFEELGIKYIEEEIPVNHLDAQSENNLKRALTLSQKNR